MLTKYNKGIIFGIISIILAVVFISGCTDSANTELTKTFSKGNVSFNYPSDWFEMPYTDDGIKSDAQVIGFVSPANMECDFSIQKIPSSTIKEVKDTNIQFDKLNRNATVLNQTTTTVNGLSAYQVLYTYKDPDVSDKEMKESEYFIQKGNNVYLVEFRVYSVNDFDKYTEISNKMLSTVKIN